ncbi:MAG: citrate lyase subunit alpha, partial [Pseudomonadota bacterium]|nr:citrate lyase subunit alpha [Pseudomonadota bacterium]
DKGMAINPKRKDLIEKVKGKIDIVPIEKLKDMAYDATGGPQELEFIDRHYNPLPINCGAGTDKPAA